LRTLLSCSPLYFEFKVGDRDFSLSACDQAFDYALDLKNFHDATHTLPVAPVLIATEAKKARHQDFVFTPHNDGLLVPICSTVDEFPSVIDRVLSLSSGSRIEPGVWEQGRYSPTPSVVEAATALYSGHSVVDISRSDAGAINLTRTSDAISNIICHARDNSRKSICFVTGVPGAGKTLVGLDIATKHIDSSSKLHSVFLSGNGPLVAILREALARDKVLREKADGRRMKKGTAMSEVKVFVQNVHHFRDDCLIDDGPPIEHVALFDEAQRAWNREQTVAFMRRKKNRPDFDESAPEFLISCVGGWRARDS
jgi:hypothetical protein